MREAKATIERFVAALGERDLAAAMALYHPDASWEVHVPGGDGLQEGVAEIAALMDPWFTGRAGFAVERSRIIGDGPTLALQWQLHWRDAADGAPCVSHQSHVFEVEDSLIRRHWLYCSGVRVYDLAPDDGAAEPEPVAAGA
jgi:limonene-1,2-epoxide hydrolase